MLHGLVSLLGAENVVDFPRLDSARAPPHGPWSNENLWGHGFTYARWLDWGDSSGGTNNATFMEAAIKARAFDVIIFGTVRRQHPFFYDVLSAYSGDPVGTWHTGAESAGRRAPALRRVMFIDAEDHSGWSPEAAAFAHRATFIMRERPMGCPHRDRYYTKYAMTLVHSHHELMKRMYDALGHGEASVELSVLSVRHLVQVVMGFRWIPTAAGGWVSSFANRNIVTCPWESRSFFIEEAEISLEVAAARGEGYPAKNLSNLHLGMCRDLMLAIMAFRADLSSVSSQFHDTKPLWWEQEVEEGSSVGDEQRGDEHTEDWIDKAWLHLGMAEFLLLFDAASCPHFCHEIGPRYECVKNDRLGPLLEAESLVDSAEQLVDLRMANGNPADLERPRNVIVEQGLFGLSYGDLDLDDPARINRTATDIRRIGAYLKEDVSVAKAQLETGA